ncbi:MAG: efflux RND transporter periplasmic adaptor subunit [Burkholderiales bacterium]
MKYKLVMAAVLAAVLVAACGEHESAPDAKPPKLEDGRITFPQGSPQLQSFVSEPVKAGGPQRLRLPGRLVWNEERTVRLFPAFGGRVTRILVKPGDAVRPGQPLAVLASPDFGQVQADAHRAQSDFALAGKNLDRVRELNAAGVSPRKDLSAAEADYARAEAELARAGNRVKLYAGTDQSVDQNLALTSPIAGVVVERNINPGQELRPDLQLANSPAMFVITDPSRLWVLLDATESQLAGLRRGQMVTLRSSAWPGETFRASVDAISDFIDPATRTVKVRGSLDNRGRKLKGEMFVAAELETPSRAGLQVPSKAVVLMGDRDYVFVEEAPGRFARVEVKTDGEHDGVTGIVSGLTLGQKVVVEGNLLLQRLYRQLTSGAPG